MEKLLLKEELVNYIEGLQFEVESRKAVICYMISSGVDVAEEGFRKYQGEFKEAFSKFEIAKKELIRESLGKNALEKINWKLDYETRELSYETI